MERNPGGHKIHGRVCLKGVLGEFLEVSIESGIAGVAAGALALAVRRYDLIIPAGTAGVFLFLYREVKRRGYCDKQD